MSLWGALWWRLLPIRKAEAIAGFRAAFPDLDPELLRCSMDDLVEGYLDLLRGRRAEITGIEHLMGPCAALAGHGSGWDLALISAAEQVPVTIFVRRPTSRIAAWVIDRLRAQGDLELLPPRDSMAAAYDAYARGRVVVFVQDQRHNAGLTVPFFGRPARTSPAFGAFVWKTRARVAGGWPSRDADGRWRLDIAPVPVQIPEDRDAAIQHLTAESQRFYEARIREHPAGWLWLHRRWA